MKAPYQLFKDLPPAVESALRGSIDRFGVLVPVAKDQRGNILDGHQRARLAESLGIKYPVNIIEVADDYEAREIARTLNEDRRAMPKEERLPVVQALREDGHSLRAIAGAVGVSHEQVRKDLAPVNDLTPDQTRGLDGKSYPARKQPVVPATFAARERQQAREEVLARETESSPRRPLIAVSDYATWLSKRGPCDLLLTDPPYSTDVDDVAAFAGEWLPLALAKVKSTGRAYVFIGAYPDEIAAYVAASRRVSSPTLANVLVWTYRNTIGPKPTHTYKLNWQAILYFTGSDTPPLNCPAMVEQFSVQDVSAPDGRQGDRYHTWQKPLTLAERFIRHATKPDDLVYDCFAGTGTHLIAAAHLGRRSEGCDSDPEMVSIAVQRGCCNA